MSSGARRGKKAAAPEPVLKIPSILLEGDEPAPPLAGPGEKYALGPTPPAGPSRPEGGELPAAYGTGKLLLVARDPHWLYAHWDLTPEQQRRFNALSADRHLVVRVRPGTVTAHPSSEVHVHPESRSWFIHVERAGTRYAVELGYYPANRQWVTVATSAPAATPPDTVSTDRTLRFATIPADVPLRDLAAPGKAARRVEPPPLGAAPAPALAKALESHLTRREEASSAEITDLIRGPRDIFPAPLALAAPSGVQVESVSSPLGGEQPRPEGFWLKVNAELVLYGATEPDANVSVGGRPIQMRPDGTFSFRFALPDGDHAVTVSAVSAEGDLRQAGLKFSRRTEYQGEVGAAPQDPSLKPRRHATPNFSLQPLASSLKPLAFLPPCPATWLSSSTRTCRSSGIRSTRSSSRKAGSLRPSPKPTCRCCNCWRAGGGTVWTRRSR